MDVVDLAPFYAHLADARVQGAGLVVGRDGDRVAVSSRGQLHRSTFVRQTGWSEAGRGRTLHDLRHTAACEWILPGVPLTTVEAWLGHSSVEITARYLHHLGDSADRSALQLLNDSAARALTPGVISG